ncbi:MAG: hypothetical protein CSA21_07275 [Deltaproteobacteria bacterium]|nr:MAG: hypothetical protein CSA21_07275 [Deltaproteobacteria bacterium]
MSGRLELLPTGRNFHGGDISRLPTRTAWQRGQELAEALLEKYRKEEGYYPKRVALSIWSTDAFKNDGELLCQILFLLGTEPCWDNRDKVTDVVPITLENLGRPRIDVTIETSSVMREMVPHFCDLMDRAVLAVSELAETDEENYVAMHYRQLLNELRQDTQRQLDKLSIRRLASCRVFSSATGTTGGGVALALDASAWTTEAELAEIHVNQHGHAWVDGRMINACDLFARQMGEVELAYIKQGSEQYDLLDTGYYATTLGGVAMTGKAMRGSRPRLLWHEAGVGGELCDIEEELWHSTAGRLLNVHWFTAMKKHGIRGAAAVSDRVNNLYKWSATTGKVAKELFDRVVEFYVENKENRCWLHEENPYALEEITRRLLEAAARDLWQADDNKLKILRDTALMIEGDMEESIGEVSGDFQGGGVEIVGMDKVEKWQHAWRLPDKGRE